MLKEDKTEQRDHLEDWIKHHEWDSQDRPNTSDSKRKDLKYSTQVKSVRPEN